MNQTIANLPPYLKQYCQEQRQDHYTPRNHAAWRYIMRQSREYFRDHAVAIYLEGLEKTGITITHIPRIDEMDAQLRKIGWGAVPVRGFIPPAAFLEFQARRILPIAADMRNIDNIHYTPAPDIVHEAAGHAPILADEEYSEYLTLYAAMAQKAIFSQEDLNIYEAVRTLSDIKENPDTTPQMIRDAEMKLDEANRSATFVSEAAKVARMNWWTVEYGLLGSLTDPKIYGAGLLSSVGESQACLSDKVKKIPLSVDCTNTSYDITEPQPQLFVAENISHLRQVLREFEETLSFKVGGLAALAEGKRGKTVTTTEFAGGLQVSGIIDDYVTRDEGIEFIRWQGPTQICVDGSELPDQGIAHHPHGFSSPVGPWHSTKRQAVSPEQIAAMNDAELNAEFGLQLDSQAQLTTAAGYQVQGRVVGFIRDEGKLRLIKWRDCRVTRGSEVLFEPDWGDFDMLVATNQVSGVAGGPANREAYGSHDVGTASTSPVRQSPYTAQEKEAFAMYAETRQLRELDDKTLGQQSGKLRDLLEITQGDFKDSWLLRLEAIELGLRLPTLQSEVEQARKALLKDGPKFGDIAQQLMTQGLTIAHVSDSN